MSQSCKIYDDKTTDANELCIDVNNTAELAQAMLFKSEHIKAKADPELFRAVAAKLQLLSQIEHVVVNNDMSKINKYAVIETLIRKDRQHE